jgi:hypothetical protein
MRLERRITVPEPRDTKRRDHAQRVADAMFPNADRVDVCFYENRFLAFPFVKGIARAHELEEA